jgi:hypothetical protein
MALMPGVTRIEESLLARVDRFAGQGGDTRRAREDNMNIRAVSKTEFVIKAGVHRHDHSHTGHAHIWQRAMSRRQFIRTAAGAAGVGAAVGSGVWRPRLAKADQSYEPVPIPGGTPVAGGVFHVFGPALSDPPDAEPSTITDFNGFVGLAYISGEVMRTNTETGEVLTLPFMNSDMRFMQGVFRGTDGQMHQGAFALV